jgi:hypothetical protein
MNKRRGTKELKSKITSEFKITIRKAVFYRVIQDPEAGG